IDDLAEEQFRANTDDFGTHGDFTERHDITAARNFSGRREVCILPRVKARRGTLLWQSGGVF
ncbi:MAG: hypothetical protein L0191_15700, partial [Acidobacteria bacterium]|nr:hypothetical protein [Acidobacteriota bacterium]